MQTAEHEIVFLNRPDGNIRVELLIDNERVSWLTILPFVIRIGSVEVEMDGIAGVGTDSKHRMKGYSRRVLEATIEYMSQGDAAISMLYGIRDFYPKFGYATVGADHFVALTRLDTSSKMPAGWGVRSFTANDLPVVRDTYRNGMSQATGAAVRPDDGKTWSLLLASAESDDNDCRVILGPDGEIHGYAWLASKSHSVRNLLSKRYTDALIVGEAVADSSTCADALLAACRLWAQEVSTEQDFEHILLAVTPETVIAAAAMRQDARIICDYDACGGSMVRVLDVKRLLEALKPEILLRLQSSSSTFTGRLIIRTDIGDAALMVKREGICVENVSEGMDGLIVEMPQTALGRLAFGVFPPEDVLARLPEPPDETASKLIQLMFPLRHPHMYPPDRF